MPPRHRYPTSPPADPLDDENLLAEFLLRLPPRPSSLPRAAAVCKTWSRVVTDPHFLRRFRAHHRIRKAPLLGFFDSEGTLFPTLEAPDRVPASRLSVGWNVVACLDGLLLCSQGLQLQVLDPMTGDRSAILTREDKLPEPLNVELVVDSVERLCFRLFAISTDADETELSVSVYSSHSSAWARTVETLVTEPASSFRQCPSTFVGNAFYCSHIHRILWYDLGYDLQTQTIAIIEVPWNEEGGEKVHVDHARCRIRTNDGLLGTEILYGDEPTIQIWVKEIVLSGAAKWVMRKTILLNTLLPLELKLYGKASFIMGFEKDNNVIFMWTPIAIFMINIESEKFTKVSEETNINAIHPYSSFVDAGFTRCK